MVFLTCPNCGHRFPVALLESRGWCKCGMDFDLQPDRGLVLWTPDPAYTRPDAPPVAEVIPR